MIRLLLLSLLLWGCSEPGPPVQAGGTYDLTLLNGELLPYDGAAGCCTYLEGEITLQNGNYHATLTTRSRGSGQLFTAEEVGTFTQSGAELTFFAIEVVVQPLDLAAGTVAGETVSLVIAGFGGIEAVYERR